MDKMFWNFPSIALIGIGPRIKVSCWNARVKLVVMFNYIIFLF